MWYATTLVTLIGWPGLACTRYTILPVSSSALVKIAVVVVGVDLMIDSDRQGHLGVGAAVAEDDPLVLPPVTLRLEHPGLEGISPCADRPPVPIAWDRTWYSSRPSCRLSVCEEITTGASASSIVTSMVMIARCRWVKETIRVELTLTRLPPGVRQMMSRRNTSVTKVQRALVGFKIGYREQHRLVVDVELDRLVVGYVDDGLADSREAEGLLGMPDRPGFVEAVDEGSVGVGLPALLDVAPHARGNRSRRRTAISVTPRSSGCTRPR